MIQYTVENRKEKSVHCDPAMQINMLYPKMLEQWGYSGKSHSLIYSFPTFYNGQVELG